VKKTVLTANFVDNAGVIKEQTSFVMDGLAQVSRTNNTLLGAISLERVAVKIGLSLVDADGKDTDMLTVKSTSGVEEWAAEASDVIISLRRGSSKTYLGSTHYNADATPVDKEYIYSAQPTDIFSTDYYQKGNKMVLTQNFRLNDHVTQILNEVLMDYSNKVNGIVIGTGDLSELALGWCTYNGDHMSMYGVNASIPKTLVRSLVKSYADTKTDGAVQKTLLDICDTPISPELLPPNPDGTIAQKTEESIGSYIIHDFTLYYMMRFGFSPKKIYKLCLNAMMNEYGADNKEVYKEEILKNMKIFYNRFFKQQFKRSCSPDGVKVGSISLSPRSDWRMPSDAVANLWLKELNEIK
jgi:NH3-dependent NAD+ synthetase